MATAYKEDRVAISAPAAAAIVLLLLCAVELAGSVRQPARLIDATPPYSRRAISQSLFSADDINSQKADICTPLDLSDIDDRLARAKKAPLVTGVVPSFSDQIPLEHVNVSESTTLEKAAAYLRVTSEYKSYWVLRHTLLEDTEGHVFLPYTESSNGLGRQVPDVLLYDSDDKSGHSLGSFPFLSGTGFRLRFHKDRVFSDEAKKATYDMERVCDVVDVIPEGGCSCCVLAPYPHGVMAPASVALGGATTPSAPWDLSSVRRSTLLTFCGSSWRGDMGTSSRFKTLERFHELSREAEAQYRHRHRDGHVASHNHVQLFSAPLEMRRHSDEAVLGWGTSGSFYRLPWEAYAGAEFSWQPHGDTATRRAFFDSWLMGCIPVIDTRAARVYSAMFHGLLFDGKYRRLEDIAIVLDDDTMYDAEVVLRTLEEMPAEEVTCRQQRLRQLAPLLQWGHPAGGKGYDAFDMVLASLVRE